MIKKTKKSTKRKILIAFLIVLIILFLATVAVCCAYIGDFLVYKDTADDGKLLTYAQRTSGIFGIW
ncbi:MULTISPECIES: hypothetical protein [unclassified Mycoplasma]|uniref:hypothetical protein n=1 Tax=unclassified Mycoplasma TaxID=2683645 RepID=UPI00211C2C6C|nr:MULTISPECIES: hypothetical protein [unclassified Mycoplasma]UUM19831.1 hypothetical protein NPA11_00090 [Mycoplasma sp. 1578d]UUM24815.1 hypothetical protein NPA12_00090 [Mycoplasma sp. 3686d]